MARGKTDSKPWGWGSDWGTYSATSELPNVSGAAEQDSNLNVGDTATVSTEKYVCTVAAPSGATWQLMHRNGSTTATTHGGALAVTGATTLTGGIVSATMGEVSNIPLGSVAYGSLGTDGVHVAGTMYYSELWLPANKTITGIAVLNGTTAGTDKLVLALASSAGAILANTLLTGTTASGTDAFQKIALTATYAAVGPARYFLVLQAEGTTTKTRKIAASTYRNFAAKTAGSFGTLASFTPPTSTTADEGPIGFVY